MNKLPIANNEWSFTVNLASSYTAPCDPCIIS